MIRPITVDDLPWVLSLGSRRYKDGDPGGALVALSQAMRSPTALAIRSDYGFLVANINIVGWYPQKRNCYVLAVCVEEGHHSWDAIKLLRASVEWAKEQKCERWWFTSDLEHEREVASLAERLGAWVVPHYVIKLGESR